MRDSSTVCSNCKTPVATWWDEATQTPRTHREALLPFTVTPQPGENDTMSRRRNTQSIEERSFQAALICLEQHFEKLAGLGPKTLPEVKAMVRTTLEQSLNKADVRYILLLFENRVYFTAAIKQANGLLIESALPRMSISGCAFGKSSCSQYGHSKNALFVTHMWRMGYPQGETLLRTQA